MKGTAQCKFLNGNTEGLEMVDEDFFPFSSCLLPPIHSFAHSFTKHWVATESSYGHHHSHRPWLRQSWSCSSQTHHALFPSWPLHVSFQMWLIPDPDSDRSLHLPPPWGPLWPPSRFEFWILCGTNSTRPNALCPHCYLLDDLWAGLWALQECWSYLVCLPIAYTPSRGELETLEKFFFFLFLGPHQTRGQIGAAAAGLHPSHSNTGSKPNLRYSSW